MSHPTSGPWIPVLCDGYVTIRTPGSALILAQVMPPGKVLTSDNQEQLANSALMAAAPKLLDALTRLLTSYYDKTEGPALKPYLGAGKDSEIKENWIAAYRAVEAARKLPREFPEFTPPRRTQAQMFYAAHASIAGLNELMTDMIREGDITNDELAKLIAKRPEVYGRFSGYVGTLPQ